MRRDHSVCEEWMVDRSGKVKSEGYELGQYVLDQKYSFQIVIE